MKRVRVLLMVGVVLAVAWAAERKTFVADDPVQRDVVTITGDAPLEFIATRTQQVKGQVEVDPQNVLADPKASFEIEVANLTTGIRLRDEHMRSAGWLDAAQYPLVRFTLKQVKSPTQPTALVPGRPLAADVVGTLELHGKSQDLPARLTATLLPADNDTAARLPGDLLRLDAEFDLLLSDFGVVIPEKALRKVANRQHVHAVLFTSTQRLVLK